ncbi:hypothetical protein HPB50_017164 [Hyalomma asiaticum]|uniref:Uncharacterized protein n=1 Tax=Hyalomma asiaticum TaxID=266040 RepID=A0ACB7TCV0_HYAAI|nr:hypothetical protein HPB50_017164 [Hyalomma asiaticum]
MPRPFGCGPEVNFKEREKSMKKRERERKKEGDAVSGMPFMTSCHLPEQRRARQFTEIDKERRREELSPVVASPSGTGDRNCADVEKRPPTWVVHRCSYCSWWALPWHRTPPSNPTCTTIFNQSRRKFRQLFNFRVEAGVISACRLRCYNPNTAESLRVNRDDGERCQNRLYEGTCRGGVCRSPNEAIAAIGSVIPIPYQEANAFSNPNDHGIQVEEPGFGEEFVHDGFHSDRFEESFGGRPVQTRFPAVPLPSVVQGVNDTLIA